MTLTHITTEQAEAAALARVAELETFLQGIITELRARIAELENEAAITTERCAQMAIDETMGDEEAEDIGERIAAKIRASLKDKP